MSFYKNRIPAIWNILTGILAIGILFMVWFMYFFMIQIPDVGSFIISPFILCAFLSLFALVPFFILWTAKSTSYEISYEGVVITNPLGQRGLWPYSCITSIRKIALSELATESLKNALTKQYFGPTILPEKLLFPYLLSSEPRVVIDTSVNGFMGLKITLITNPENMDQFIAELNNRLASNKRE